MVTSSDREYKQTKSIKLGKKKLKEPFLELAQWISETYDVSVINVVHDVPDERSRLQVITETKSDQKSFQKGELGNFDSSKQKAIGKKFTEILKRDGIKKYETKGLFVVFSAFAPIAIQEANGSISDSEIKDLKRRIGNPDLWTVERCFDQTTFFVETEEQVRELQNSELKNRYLEEYLKILKRYDIFDYIDESSFHILFDSRENFEKNYQGNWFYYWR